MTAESGRSPLFRRHLLVGWSALLAFLTLGLVLDTFHGFKVNWYLDVENETRRHMWTLAHAHGVLLGLVNAAFAFTVEFLEREGWSGPTRSAASSCLLGATLLMPSGFLLGGIWQYGGDPGLGVLLVPVGGLFLLIAVALTVARVRESWRR